MKRKQHREKKTRERDKRYYIEHLNGRANETTKYPVENHTQLLYNNRQFWTQSLFFLFCYKYGRVTRVQYPSSSKNTYKNKHWTKTAKQNEQNNNNKNQREKQRVGQITEKNQPSQTDITIIIRNFDEIYIIHHSYIIGECVRAGLHKQVRRIRKRKEKKTTRKNRKK